MVQGTEGTLFSFFGVGLGGASFTWHWLTTCIYRQESNCAWQVGKGWTKNDLNLLWALWRCPSHILREWKGRLGQVLL